MFYMFVNELFHLMLFFLGCLPFPRVNEYYRLVCVAVVTIAQ